MCGRMRQPSKTEILNALSDILSSPITFGKKMGDAQTPDHWSMYSTPDHPVLVVVERVTDDRVEYVLTSMHWGYSGSDMYNARLETIKTTSMWSDDFNMRRCIIPLAMFHEGGVDFAIRNEAPMLVAGIFTRNENHGLRSVSMITKPSTGLVATHHQRQPAVVPDEMVGRYLDRSHSLSDVDRMKLHSGSPSFIVVG